MNELRLREGGPSVETAISASTVEFLREHKIVDAVDIGGSRWLISPRTLVGAITVDELTVRIDPKLDDIDQIVFLLGYAKRPGWRPSVVSFEHHDDFVNALADAFTTTATDALARGLVQGYREVEDSLPVLRGRLREQEQLRRQFGIALPVLVRYDDYTVNIAENQILHTAVDKLLRLPDLRPSTLAQLRSMRFNLIDVDVIQRGRPLPCWTASRLNERYQPALHLAEIILADASFSQRAGDTRAVGFMIDMAKVFEDFVTAAVTEALRDFGGRCWPHDPNYLDDAERVHIKPDLVWRDHGGDPLAVIDAKYKAEKPDGFPDADLYQMLAYCTALNLTEGHLVYAKGSESPLTHVVRNTGIAIRCHAIDLARRPNELLDQVETLAATIAANGRARTRRGVA